MPDPAPPSSDARFASSTHTAEDLLKEQTVGLVHYSDFRKRRAEALEQQSGGSGTSTPTGDESRYVYVIDAYRNAIAAMGSYVKERLTDQAQ